YGFADERAADLPVAELARRAEEEVLVVERADGGEPFVGWLFVLREQTRGVVGEGEGRQEEQGTQSGEARHGGTPCEERGRWRRDYARATAASIRWMNGQERVQPPRGFRPWLLTS